MHHFSFPIRLFYFLILCAFSIFILKQISDKAFEKILELYIKSEKQVIIAIDKKNSYTDETQKILDESVFI